jgi:hypothetical protein
MALSIITVTALDSKPEKRQQRVLFGQKRASPNFSTDDDNVPENISGRTLPQVEADLRSGEMTSERN